MRKFAAVFFACACLTVSAQEDNSNNAPPPVPMADSSQPNMLTSFAGAFLQGDFVNYYAFVNGVYDTTQQTLQSKNVGSGGFGIGGGVTGSKQFSDSILSLNYRGDYRNYSGGFGGSGTDQYLSLVYSKRLSRRWTLLFNEAAGILYYSSAYFPNLPSGGGTVGNNPFSPSTRFLSSSVYLSYRQTQRLTYTLGGSFFLSRYSYAGSFGSTGGILSASASYALTARTSIGGTYSHDNFYYQHGAGNTALDGGYFNASHIFAGSWNVHASAGITYANTSGFITLPVSLILAGQPTDVGYITGPYHTTTTVPTFDGGVTRRFRTFSVTASAGRGVNPGNGSYLTSSHTYVGGSAAKPFHNALLSGNASYSRVSSIANQVSQSYSQNILNITYSRILIPHLSTFATYSYIKYGSLLGLNASTDNRFIFGLSFSSKNIPLAVY